MPRVARKSQNELYRKSSRGPFPLSEGKDTSVRACVVRALVSPVDLFVLLLSEGKDTLDSRCVRSSRQSTSPGHVMS